ncbi:hypothetical protein BJ875DRAFT_486103 [Amylocarpus encephaloides]|uniref:Uncharacterized protein n=1 Tax=Amylocarpus encephaloides TaxID=45428 RepID=A0A9P7YF88_9HELO|nr:hypothetical protein BJ875DRAFT_486103 [Amylocarpus encephaloides]
MAANFHRPQSIRLWFSSKRKGRGHISSLSIDQLLKTKVAIRTKVTPSVERWLDEREDVSGNPYSTYDGNETIRRRKSRPLNVYYPPGYEPQHTEIRVSQMERRILPTGAVQVIRRPTCNRCPHPGQQCSFKDYTVPKPRGPIPPRRTSSLPKESRAIEAISSPAAPMMNFSLSQQDGLFFQYLITGSLNKLDLFSIARLWPLALQRFQTEPSVRHIMLGTAMIHRSRSDPNLSRVEEAHRLASRHYGKAVRLLSDSLSHVNSTIDGETRELTLLTTYLLAVFEILRRKDERACWWMKSGAKMLKLAVIPAIAPATNSKMARNSKQLALGFELMDINLRVKMMKTTKKRERSLGKCGAGGLRRKERARTSCIGMWPTKA